MTSSDDQPTPGELPDYGSVPQTGGPTPPATNPLDPTFATSQPKRPVNQKAIWSLVIAIASLIGVCCVFGGFVGIAAIALGVMGRAEVLQSGGRQTGEGLALAGIITGAVAEFGSITMLLVTSFG